MTHTVLLHVRERKRQRKPKRIDPRNPAYVAPAHTVGHPTEIRFYKQVSVIKHSITVQCIMYRIVLEINA